MGILNQTSKIMDIKENLQNKINNGTICGDDLLIGRKMNFGKYKGKYILWLLSKHPLYMKWIIENTAFQLNNVEQWWKEEVETALLLAHADSIIYGVEKQMVKCDDFPESNPHFIVE